MRVLIADDDIDFLNNFSVYLKEKYSFNVDIAKNGIEAKELYQNNRYDYVILYDNLNLIPGFSLIKEFRKIYNCFITITSKRDDAFYEKYVYSNGANDFLIKPVDYEKIGYKISNYFSLSDIKVIDIGGISIDSDGRYLYVDGVCKTLTLKEFELLTYLIKNRGKAVSREQIFKDVWNFTGLSIDDRTIDTHIKMLRNQLGVYKNYIETYRGYGYKFEVK